MERKPIVGINMKTYQPLPNQAVSYAQSFLDLMGSEKDIDIFYIPTAPLLYPVSKILKNSSIQYGAQNCGPTDSGSLTGEIAIDSLEALQCSLVIVGHYERRNLFFESKDMIANKVKLALKRDISPILCIGEEEKILDLTIRKEIFQKDMEECLKGIGSKEVSNLIIAYEPFWAIGKEESADPEYVHDSHQLLRDILVETFGEEYGEQALIIYGGSVSQSTAYDLANHKEVDGLFVGRFGHVPKRFQQIVEEVKKAKLSSK